LANAYDRWSVEILGNVALATHGASVSEILGSGNAAEPFQQFTLKQAPLTYVAASSASGAASSLQVRVADVLWREVPTLFGHGPQDRVYITRMADDGKVTVEFGDGRSGARLPSGQDNVRAVYRKGIGLGGLVDAGQLSLLLSRPLGVTGASNPQPAGGAADPENIDEARGNAPIGVLTLDRTVSLRDYEDFARGFAGVAKALASWSWDGQMRRIFITIAGPDGADIASRSDLYQHLVAGIGNAGDPFVTFEVKSRRLAHFRAALKVKIGDRLAEAVLRDLEAALRSRFSFAARSFGQTVNMSEVIAAAQDVPGVEAIDLDRLYRTTPPVDAPVVNPRLPAALPGMGPDGHMVAAEILVLDPGPLDLAVMP
jgi:predicted phage baseplate assembly protein